MAGTLVAHSRESDFSIEVLPDDEPAPDIDRLENLVAARTYRTIQNLRVTARDGCITITGQTSTYYHKQLATQAIVAQGIFFDNAIEVYGTRTMQPS